MNKSRVMVATLGLLISTSVLANADLAKAKNCMSCHNVDSKILGPGFKDVAKKYAGDKTAEAKLVTKVLKGGTGVWGNFPMPANAQVTEAEAKTLVKWVLALK
ncbi:MAG: c-type cytochrome [Candidatus Obscuribacterales bacterium]|nr:c-type cytochrome [Candidatus Obscuribacterales bacterium]